MSLSQRAEQYVKKKTKRRRAVTSREKIVAAIERAELPVFEPVVSFQEKYGGLTEHAWAALIVYGVLHEKPSNRIDFSPNTVSGHRDDDDGLWYFVCADTLYQVDFHIDQHGVYYEDWQPVASSFDKFIEGMATLNELSRGWNQDESPELGPLDSPGDLARLNLTIVAEASDEYTSWWRNEILCVRVRGEEAEVWRRG